MRRLQIVLGSVLAAAAAGCATDGGMNDGPLSADLRDSGGRALAQATLNPVRSAIRVRVESTGLQAGTYAAHIHSVGRCDPPDFASAGPHWNPTGREHGKDNPAGMHKGDLPNLVVGADGRGSVEYTVTGVRISGGAAALLDEDGAAVIVHTGADDYRSDPAGNAGGRMACGVVMPA